MFSQRQFGKAAVLVLLGAVCLAVPALFYYWVMRSKTVAVASGFFGIADALHGGKS